MSSILRSSKFVRYFAGLARGILISNHQDIDRSLLQRSQHLAGVFSSNLLSTTSFQANSTFDRTLRHLDEVARKTGRISLKEVEEAFNELRHIKKLSASQTLMVIRCCGNLVPEETPEQRTRLVEEIWQTFEKNGVPLDISHYNALLKIYLENEHKFLPTEFLAKLGKQGIEPNRVTYQRLIAGYCQLGDIAGATKILEFMKEKQLPVSEGVFNALILGHSRANDMESAEGILAVMKQASLDPSNDTYCTLMCGYAERGDLAAIERLITDCKGKDVLLSDKDLLEVAYAAAINGHDQIVDEILKNIRIMVGYNQDAANVLLRLITAGKDDAAYKVFLTLTPGVKTDGSINMSGHLIIKHLVNTKRSVEEIMSMCNKLEEDGHTKYGLSIALETSFTNGNVDLTLDLLRMLKNKQEPIRNHYFWPSMATLGKNGHSKRILEILNIMTSEFHLSPNVETLVDYYLPYVEEKPSFKTVKELMEVGVTRRQAVLALLNTLLSSNNLKDALNIALKNSVVNLRSAQVNRLLVDAVQQTGDIRTAVELIHIISSNQLQEVEEEEEGVGAVVDFAGRFLVGVVSSAQSRQMATQVLKEMVACGLSISNTCAELVESRLQGNQLTAEISDLLSKLSSGDLTLLPPKKSSMEEYIFPVRSVAFFERTKERIKANSTDPANLIPIVRNLFQAYCEEGDVEKALKAKQEWVEDLKQELTIGWWTKLMDLYCSKDNLEEAKHCYQKIKEFYSVVEIDSAKILKLAKLYIQNNQVDEAIALLKEAKPRKEIGFASRTNGWQLLQILADTTKDPELVKKVLNLLVDNKFVDITNVMLGPIIKAHLLRDDLEGALKEFDVCVHKYRATPWKNELASRFIEKEDAANLQRLVDLSTQVHGEINSLYDLVLSFVESGRIRQARKILETPGLHSRSNRIQNACERYAKEGLVAPLEGLVQATKDLPHIDRSEIYYNLLDTYCQTDNVDKAYGLWTQMQDEDVQVTDEFLIKLGNLLKSKNLEVPFAIPEPDEQTQEHSRKLNKETKQTKPDFLLSAIKAMDVNKALQIKNNLQNNGTQLTRIEVNRLMELLIEKNHFCDAVSLLSSYQGVASLRVINFLIQKLSQKGELDMLAEVGTLLDEEARKNTSYVNKYINCAIAAGKGKEELNKLESEIDAASTPEDVDTLSLQFPRGGIFGILESSPSYHDQVTTIAEKYFKKGSLSPANCLCMFYLGDGQIEKAKEIYQRFNLANASRIMFKNVLNKARKVSDPMLIEELLSLLGNSPALTPEAKSIIYSNLLNVYIHNGQFEEASQKLDECLKSIPIENIYHNTLTKLKEGLDHKNIPFKYTIPEKKYKEKSSSSSSSDDVEAKKSVRAEQ